MFTLRSRRAAPRRLSRISADGEQGLDGKQGLNAPFAAAGPDLEKVIVLVAPRGAQANMVLFLLPQPRQLGGGFGLKCLAACYDDIVLVAALEMPNNLLRSALGALKSS
jgi:hypothetical protein